jgi:hypothetical protein
LVAALSLPLAALASPLPPTGIAEYAITYPTVTQAMYLGGGTPAGPFPFPLGWYWVGVLVAGLLITAAWYRWRDRRGGSRTPLGGYLVSGLALAAVTAALPLLAWGKQVQLGDPGMQAWTWLDAFWRLGTFALLAVAVSLGVLARIGHSRTLAIVTAVYPPPSVSPAGMTCGSRSSSPSSTRPGTGPSCCPQPSCCSQAWAQC